MAQGSRKPILTALPSPGGYAVPGARSPSPMNAAATGADYLEQPEVELLDGRVVGVIDCLYEAGDLEIAAERAQMTELEFSRLLVGCDPRLMTEVLKAIEVVELFTLTRTVRLQILERIDDIKPEKLLAFYPKLVSLMPELIQARVNVHAAQYNFNVGTDETRVVPADVAEALRKLGVPV